MLSQLLQPEVQKFIEDHRYDDPFLLSLNARKDTTFPLKEAIEQIHSYQKAKKKLPAWTEKKNIIWPPPVSIEQASSEATAKFKSSLIQGKSLVDLTGGMGVDTVFFADRFDDIHYVESNLKLCEISRHNFKTLGKNQIIVRHQTAEDFLKKNSHHFELIYLDPSRRNESKKVFKIEDCSPNLTEILPACLRASPNVLIKLSPLVDISILLKTLSPNFIWVVGVKNEVKEVLCLVQRNMQRCRIEAVMLHDELPLEKFKFFRKQEKEAISEYSYPQKYIYEPNATIMKAGAFKLIGKHFGLKKIHQHTHLYTSDSLLENFPGKTFRVKKQVHPNKKEIHRIFPDKIVNVITRNYPITTNQFKQKYSLKDGGEDFLIATTLMDRKKVLLICAPLN